MSQTCQERKWCPLASFGGVSTMALMASSAASKHMESSWICGPDQRLTRKHFRQQLSRGRMASRSLLPKQLNYVAHRAPLKKPSRAYRRNARLDGDQGIVVQAVRTLLRNSPTSSLRRLLSLDSDFAAASTCEEAEPVSLAPRCTSVMWEETCWVPCAACWTLRESPASQHPALPRRLRWSRISRTVFRWCR
jgi:hypothetical protein